MSVSKKIRFEVFKRDKFTCQYCGRSAPDVILHVDHIHPVSEGGVDDMLNLITGCQDCNLGKSNRLLSDDTVIKKRKEQLDLLQERREQLEMMLEWQRSLMELENDTVEELAEFWSELTPGFNLNEQGIAHLAKWRKRFSLVEILEAMRISVSQYIKRENDIDASAPILQESVEKAFDYIPKICNVRRQQQDKPYLSDLYYIRGILRKRLNYVNDIRAMQIMEEAVINGIDVDAIKEIAKRVKSWTAFQNEIAALSEEDDG